MRHTVTAVMQVLMAVVLSACTSGETPSAVVRDSAGVAIVENSGVAPNRWQLGAQPLVQIGSENAGPEYQLYQVTGAFRMEDGTIAVANSGSAEIRFFDTDGVYRSGTGSSGEGPGEFRSISMLSRLPEDSLLAYDSRLARITVFDRAGNFVRSQNLSGGGGGPGAPAALGRFHNGMIPIRLMKGGIFAWAAGEAEDPNTDMSVEFQLVSAGDSSIAVGTYPAPRTNMTVGDGSISVLRIPLQPETIAAADPTSLYIGHSAVYEVHRFDETGSLERIIRYDSPPNPITPAEITRLIELRTENAPNADAARGIEASYREMEFAEFFPAFDRFVVDALGWLWIRNYQRPTDENAQWLVYSPEGYLHAEVTTSRDLTLFDAGQEYLIGTVRDDFDIEQLVMFPLTGRDSPSSSS